MVIASSGRTVARNAVAATLAPDADGRTNIDAGCDFRANGSAECDVGCAHACQDGGKDECGGDGERSCQEDGNGNCDSDDEYRVGTVIDCQEKIGKNHSVTYLKPLKSTEKLPLNW